MELTFGFPGGSRVHAQLGPFTIPTDQPPEASAPSPFALFIASIGACAAYYVLEFCQKRGISTNGLQIVEHAEKGANGMVSEVRLDVHLPDDFPAKYRDAVVRAADQCTVKKHLEHPPAVTVRAYGRLSSMAVPLER